MAWPLSKIFTSHSPADTEALGEFALKGLQQKMPVYSVRSGAGVKKSTTSGTFVAQPAQ